MTEIRRMAHGEVRVERRSLAPSRRAAPAVDPRPPAIDAAERLEELCGRVRRLMVYDREPHRFHEEKDAVCKDLARLASELRRRDGGARQCGSRR